MEFHISPATELVAPPYQVWDVRNEIENTTGEACFAAQAHRAVYRFGDVWYRAPEPPANFIPEYPDASRPAGADGAFGDHSPSGSLAVWNRCLLDNVATFGNANFKGRVVEVHGDPALNSCDDRLVEAAIPADKVTAGAYREPVELDSRSNWRSGFG